MDLGLKEKVVLITGAGSGIGQSIAMAFAREGAVVIVNDRAEQKCSETLSLIQAAGGSAAAAPFDVGDPDAVRNGVSGAEQRWGRVDILVNNAAVMLANVPFVDTDPTHWEQEIRVGLFGALHCARAVLPGMMESGWGKLVSIVSDAGRVGQEKEVVYSSAKGGLVAFTKSLAREVGRHNINVNAVSPAATNTPLRRQVLQRLAEKIGEKAVEDREGRIRRAYPLRRIGEPGDIANAVLFLSSDCASHITGQILSVNGGYAMPG